MKTKTVVETHVEKLLRENWLFFENDRNDLVAVENQETINEAAKMWNMSPEAVEAIKDSLHFIVEQIVVKLEEDLKDIWQLV